MNIKFVKVNSYPKIEGFIDLFDGLESNEELELAEKIEREIENVAWIYSSSCVFSSGDSPDECFDAMMSFLKSFDGNTIYWYQDDRDIYFSGNSPNEYGKILSDAIDRVIEKYTKKGLWPIKKSKATRKKK